MLHRCYPLPIAQAQNMLLSYVSIFGSALKMSVVPKRMMLLLDLEGVIWLSVAWRSKLGFLLLQLGHHDVPDVSSGLVDVEGHLLATQSLAYNVELQGVLIDHVGNAAL